MLRTIYTCLWTYLVIEMVTLPARVPLPTALANLQSWWTIVAG